MDLIPVHEPRFSVVTAQKATGATYTPRSLAEFVAEQMVARLAPPDPRRNLRVLDPAAGDGELLHALGAALLAAGHSTFELHAVEQHAAVALGTERRLRDEFPGVRIEVRCADFLAALPHHRAGPIFAKRGTDPFDLVIANPPYVRTQVLGADAAQELARRFGLRGRVDLYHAFLLAIPESLAAHGLAGIIVSNRFISTKGGAALRTLLPQRLSLHHLWDLGDTKLFEDAVLPAVIIASGPSTKTGEAPSVCQFSSIYSEQAGEIDRVEAEPLTALLGAPGTVKLADDRCFRVRHGVLDLGAEPGDVWRISESAGDAWLKQVLSATWRTFGQIGKIRVGVKTTADSVFIRDDWDLLGDDHRPELLRPLTTHHVGRRYRAAVTDQPKMILYPHLADGRGRAVAELSEYPKSRAYLERHRAALSGRKYVTEAGRQWYEIWVPQSPAAWPLPKLVFRDITDKPMFWIDDTGSVINGDCYWMVVDDGRTKFGGEGLLRLAVAVGNSTFIEQFYDHMFNNKLYAGRRRFISQYVEKFPIPDPASRGAKEIVRLVGDILAKRSFTSEEERALDDLVWCAFGLPPNH